MTNQNELRRRASSRILILDALTAAGARGCTNVELSAIALRFGGRIFELKKQGHNITDPVCEGGGVYRYTLQAPVAPQPGQPGWLASLPVVASIDRRGRVQPTAPPDSAPVIGGLLFDL